MNEPRLDGLIPDSLRVRTRKVVLDGLELSLDIGFHDFEIGAPQRFLVTVEVWLDVASFPEDDDADRAWNYDYLRNEILGLAREGRFNLQESFARRVYDLVAARHGVVGLRVVTRKPDIYPDCAGVGVEISSY